MLEAYFDESWTEPKNHGVTAIAGYVASQDVWASIEGHMANLPAWMLSIGGQF
jgi:hypothetical protein